MTDLREALAEYVVSRPAPGKLTFEDFLDWCDEDTWAEWVDGEVIVLTPASFPHQNIMVFLDRVMGLFTRHHQAGVVLTPPFLVRLPGHLRRGREPDIIFVRQEQLHRFKQTYFDGSPDLIVEIISPKSRTSDREDKYGEYEAAGVREYWLIDPDQRQADFFILGADGRYYPETTDEQGIFRSTALPGFWMKTCWFWQEPLPSEIDVLRELGVL